MAFARHFNGLRTRTWYLPRHSYGLKVHALVAGGMSRHSKADLADYDDYEEADEYPEARATTT